MPAIYFLRHAESMANVRSILAGRLEFSLSPGGFKDASELAREFAARFQVQRIICSPLLRARQTTAPFGQKLNLDIEIDERLVEQNLGRFSGFTYDQVESDPSYRKDRNARWDWEPEGGGESYKMISERVGPFLQGLENFHGSVLVVTHAVTLRLLRAHLEMTIPAYPEKIAGNGELWLCQFVNLKHRHEIQTLTLGKGTYRM